jgi:UDP-glucose:(heptosyl)LPS alpha-1,3-glucosyltransferase
VKFALCLFKYFPYGGLQKDFLRIANLLSQKHSVTVLTTDWQDELPKNLSVKIITVNGWTNHRRMQDFSNKALAVVQQLGCDLIVGFNKMPGLNAHFAADNCYVAQAQEKHSYFYRLTSRYRVYKALEKSVFDAKQSVKILTLTEKQKRGYQSIYQTPDERFYVLPPNFNFTDNFLDEISIQKIRHLNQIKKDELAVLMVCSAFKNKGVDRALYALKKLPIDLLAKTRLLIIGADKPKPFLQLAKKLKIDARIKFLGGRTDIFAQMRAADLLLHPARREAAGIVLLEALACGLPVLTTAQCGYAEHIEKAGAGKTLPAEFNDSELADALAFMLKSDKTSWKNNALAYANHFRNNNLANTAASIIECTEKSIF